MRKVKHRGQVFTGDNIVQRILLLRRNTGRVLEPSAGDGAFVKSLGEDVVGIEFDKKFCPSNCLNIDFFDYPVSNKFETILGNPPYVAFKYILKTTKRKLDLTSFDNRTNLYLFFIQKCFNHLSESGEIIFITPRDFAKATSSITLNNLLWENGTITHFFDLGDKSIFKGYSPNCVIWRYEKNNFSRKTETNDGIREFNNIHGQLCFTKAKYTTEFKDLFAVKVGGVSGLDEIFVHKDGNKEFVCSYTKSNGTLKKMFYNIQNEYILGHKATLKTRRIKKFNEDNWWMWGRDYYKSDEPRVYVNCKTRVEQPFFIHPCRDYDGSVLAIFIKNGMTEEEARDRLNQVDWQELGFKSGGRYMFSQKSLENTKLPEYIFPIDPKSTE
jgi:adenine-specific DNA-methyltransferase